MIRKLAGSILVLGLLVTIAFAQEKDEKPWFDMENCEVCKHMAGHEALMTHIKWELYKLDNGFMAVTVVDDAVKEEMAQVEDDMQKTIAKVMAGEQLEMCQHCAGYGALMAKGATMQEKETVGGKIALFTSTDSDVVAELHEFADKTSAAHKKMMEEMGHGHSHEHGDHSHDGEDKHEHGDHKHEQKKKDG